MRLAQPHEFSCAVLYYCITLRRHSLTHSHATPQRHRAWPERVCAAVSIEGRTMSQLSRVGVHRRHLSHDTLGMFTVAWNQTCWATTVILIQPTSPALAIFAVDSSPCSTSRGRRTRPHLLPYCTVRALHYRIVGICAAFDPLVRTLCSVHCITLPTPSQTLSFF